MILAVKEIDLTKAQSLRNLSEDRIKVLIYELIGEKKVKGQFKEKTFVIESSVSVISFKNWTNLSRTGKSSLVGKNN